ncbi:MAG TPA: L-rhamnose mutarotase [Anaeromyxobacter sp.]|nr:L-rhamnose mutarotase [Anaeromyxobacter sp.]
MQRFAFKMKLKPGAVEEYARRHASLWPELAELLRNSGIGDYSIYFDPDTDTLFAVQRQAGAASSQDLGANAVVRRWWDHMADLMVTNPDRSPVSVPLREVFHLD